ncbi:MAG: glycosyltransferase, partial [Taibaiella sp.]|nr:glycosyltransferase [Taibaiella sp.]
VLHIGKYFPPYAGGMESFLSDLVREQCEQGLICSVLVHSHEPGYRLRSEVFSCDAGEVTLIRAPLHGVFVYAPVSLSFVRLLKCEIARFKPDVIHVHVPNPSAFVLLALAIASSIPWILQWQSDVVSSRYDWRLRLLSGGYRFLEKKLLQRTASIIVSSPTYLATSKSLSSFREKCIVIPLGLRSDRLNVAAPDDQELNHSGLKILSVGRLTYYKGHKLLLQAVASMQDAALYLAGEGSERNELNRLVREYGVQDRVFLLGGVSEEGLVRLYKECDCFCLPSIERTESFGMVLLEAMALGKPCIVSDVRGSGMSWVVQHGVTGLHFENENVESLVAMLEQLKSDVEFRRRLGQAAQSRYEELFTIGKISNKILALYETVV